MLNNRNSKYNFDIVFLLGNKCLTDTNFKYYINSKKLIKCHCLIKVIIL